MLIQFPKDLICVCFI